MQEVYLRDKRGKFINGGKRKLSEVHKKRISEARKNEWKLGIRVGGWKHSEESKRKIGLANKISLKGLHPKTEFKKGMEDEKNLNWKGDFAGYVAIHNWVRKHKGRPNRCEHCGKIELNTKKIHWANIDHKYRRVLDDYIRLCASCHEKYDYKNNNK